MKKILIIEDDSIIAHIYKSRLEKDNYEVEVATDGQTGFYRIHEYRPDAVLLDLMLPKLNGIDILKKIRAQSAFQKIPVLVFTNAYVPNMIQEAFGAGASQVFNKATLTPRQVMDALANAINNGVTAPPGSTTMYTRGNTQFIVKPPPPAPTASRGNTSFETSFCEAPYNDARPAAEPAATPPPSAAASNITPLPTASATSSAKPQSDADFQADLLRTFVQTSPDTLAAIRKNLQEFSKAQDEAARLPHLLELFRKVHALTGSAGIAGLRSISQMAAAVEVLLKELHDKPKNINASTIRTVASSIDFLGELFQRGLDFERADSSPINILVVDDEILSRRAITYALEKAGLKSVSVEDPQVALNLATETTFNLILLDVQMPGMDGFDLCQRIRGLANNKTTPVIFVTSLTDFKSRAKSTLSGGTDLIAKPFMFIELSVKALTYVFKGQFAKRAELLKNAA